MLFMFDLLAPLNHHFGVRRPGGALVNPMVQLVCFESNICPPQAADQSGANPRSKGHDCGLKYKTIPAPAAANRKPT
jgi:hypothetical protein